jgi:hypothetical protein
MIITINQGIDIKRQNTVIKPVPFLSESQPASGPAARRKSKPLVSMSWHDVKARDD